MSKKRIYTNIAITAPLITAIMAPQVAWADNTPTANTPATFAASDSSNANTPQNTTTRASDIIDENNTTVIELTNTEKYELSKAVLDIGDESYDALTLLNMQNEAARKAKARGEAMHKMLEGIANTRDELAAKADAEKRIEEEAKARAEAEAKRLADEAAKRAEEKAKAETETAETAQKSVEQQPQQTASVSADNTTALANAQVVAAQSVAQRTYTPSSETPSNTTASTATTYSSNFDVRVSNTPKAATVAVDTSSLDATRAGIVNSAKSGLGGAYIWGGKTFKAWDCSGFVSWVYAQHGIKLTAYTYSMVGELKVTNSPKPGDIVFQNGYSHVGIYIGDGKMISALNPTEGTIVHSVSVMSVDGYYTAL